MTYSQWDIAIIPFPFTDRNATKNRPIVLLSTHEFIQQSEHCIAAMITSSSQLQWPGDTAIQDLGSAGLPKASVIRLKTFTLPAASIRRKIGHLSQTDQRLFCAHWKNAVF